MRRKTIIDCDPGQDDALMLLMACASPDVLDILGVSAVAGNVPLQKTERNVRIVSDIADRADIPVFAGCEKPMRREGVTAEYVHGQEGIDGAPIFIPQTPLQKTHGVDFIIETLMSADDDDITIVATGPLTNIGTAISREPGILPKIKEIVIMGGAMREGGNITPSAEFNIYVDPDAAHLVFTAGRPLSVFGLDASHQVFTTPAILARIGALKTKAAEAAHGMLTYFGRYDAKKYGAEGAPLHDPCTIAYLLKPSLFTMKPCNIRIETESALTLGHTAVDFWHVTDEPKNAQWAYHVDCDGFFDLLIDCLGRLS